MYLIEKLLLKVYIRCVLCTWLNLLCVFFFQFSEHPDNQSLSVLSYTPAVEDDGKFLTCRAENKFIENSAIEERWRLVVHCK